MRSTQLRVVVNPEDEAEIRRLAAVAGMSVSAYLRAAGLNHQLRSTLDHAAVRDLVGVAGNLGRLGGLLKLWLADKRGIGAKPIDLDRLLKEIRAEIEAIRGMLTRA